MDMKVCTYLSYMWVSNCCFVSFHIQYSVRFYSADEMRLFCFNLKWHLTYFTCSSLFAQHLGQYSENHSEYSHCILESLCPNWNSLTISVQNIIINGRKCWEMLRHDFVWLLWKFVWAFPSRNGQNVSIGKPGRSSGGCHSRVTSRFKWSFCVAYWLPMDTGVRTR